MTPTKIITLSAAGFLSLITAICSYHSVPAGHIGVETLFGKVSKEPIPEGANFLNPFSRVHDYDCREDQFTIDSISFPSQDQLSSSADITVKWRIAKEMAPEIYQNTGNRDEVFTRQLEPKTRALVREGSRSVKTAEEFYNNTTQETIQKSMTEGLREAMVSKGILIDEVMVRDVQLPPVVMQGVQNKKIREQKAQEQEAELARFATEQQQKVKQASAEKEAAAMEAEKTAIVATAKANQLVTEAKAKAEALEIEGKAIRENPLVLQMRAIEGWDGHLPQVLGDAELLLNLSEKVQKSLDSAQ